MFSDLDRIPACDAQTDGQTDILHRVVKWLDFKEQFVTYVMSCLATKTEYRRVTHRRTDRQTSCIAW